MTGISRIHGQVLQGTSLNVTGSQGSFFSGYQPLFIKIAGSGVATLDSVDGTTHVITEGTRSKAIRAIETLGSVLMVDDASATTALTVAVDGGSFNQGAGAVTSGLFGALFDVVSGATGVAVGSLTITTGTSITSAGSLNLA
jgi:hypothetical protein